MFQKITSKTRFMRTWIKLFRITWLFRGVATIMKYRQNETQNDFLHAVITSFAKKFQTHPEAFQTVKEKTTKVETNPNHEVRSMGKRTGHNTARIPSANLSRCAETNSFNSNVS